MKVGEAMKLTGGPAFPTLADNGHAMNQDGMTLRQYAAIHLKVPDSGTDWLDDMIRQANKIDSIGCPGAGRQCNGHPRKEG